MISITKREQAIKMVASGSRVDFYIDNYYQMKSTIEKMTPTINMNDYRIEDISKSEIFMLFSKTQRGRQIRDIYDQGVERLHKSGELPLIYAKYERDYPIGF